MANGRLIAEAVGPTGGTRSPDNIVLTHIASSHPRQTALYASLVSFDAHRALRMRAASLTRIVVHLIHPIAPDVGALLRACGAGARGVCGCERAVP